MLKKSVIPNAVNAAPDDKNMIPNLRLEDVNAVGNLVFDDLRRYILYVYYDVMDELMRIRCITSNRKRIATTLLTEEDPLPRSS